MAFDDNYSYKEDIDSLNGLTGGSSYDTAANDNPATPFPENHIKQNDTSRKRIDNLTKTLMDTYVFATVMAKLL
jgi:hypothetical protein